MKPRHMNLSQILCSFDFTIFISFGIGAQFSDGMVIFVLVYLLATEKHSILGHQLPFEVL